MIILYRALSVIINSAALLLAISLVFSIPIMISSPLTMLSAFMIAAVILYSWFSSKFRREVLQQQKTVKHNLRDWVRVNGMVTLIFSTLTIMNVSVMLQNPQLFTEALKSFNVQMPFKTITTFFVIMLIYALILVIHISWTFSLMKKNKDFFQ